MTQSVTVNLPGREELREARQELDAAINRPEETATIEEEIESYLAQQGNDRNYALAKLRMDLERELRRVLGKRQEMDAPDQLRGKFLSARSLFREFVRHFPRYENMYHSFDYVIKVCNAAIHGQTLPVGHTDEALHMGIRILDELKSLDAD